MRMEPDVGACLYSTGLDPMTKKPVAVAKNLRDRKLQRALMQFFKPANYFEVREAFLQAGRQDLVGNGRDALIPPNPPREALLTKRDCANRELKDPDFITPSPILSGASNRGSGACRTKAVGQRARQRGARPRGAGGKAAVQTHARIPSARLIELDRRTVRQSVPAQHPRRAPQGF
jgi:uncharacterized protein DUF3362